MKNIVYKLSVALLTGSILLAACGANPAASTGLPAEITLGAVHDLTGSSAVYGKSIQKGIDLAVQQINGQAFFGAGHTFKVVYQDAAGDPDQAANAYEKMIANPAIVAILGPTLSTEALAADPLAQKAGIPVVASSNTVAGITEMGNFIFRTSLPESAVIPNTIKVSLAALHYSKVAILYESDDAYTQGAYTVFKTVLQAASVQILTEETYPKATTDFSAQLTRIKALNPDAIIVSAYTAEAANIMIQARQLGIPDSVRFIGANGFNSPALAKTAGLAAEGTISGAAWIATSSFPANLDFVKSFTAAYGSAPDQFAAQAFTAAWVTAIAIKNANRVDRSAVRDALAQVKDFNSPLGVFSFDAQREPVHAPVVQVVKNGAFVLFQP